jgi:hypothetical protein
MVWILARYLAIEAGNFSTLSRVLLPCNVVFGLLSLNARVQLVIDDFFIPEPSELII